MLLISNGTLPSFYHSTLSATIAAGHLPFFATIWENSVDGTTPANAQANSIYADLLTQWGCVFQLTWLKEFDVEDLLHVAVVGGDLENGHRIVLDARKIHGDDVVRDTRPADFAILLTHFEDFCPQPIKNTGLQLCNNHPIGTNIRQSFATVLQASQSFPLTPSGLCDIHADFTASIKQV